MKLLDFIETLERLLGRKANMEFLPMLSGDVKATFADIDDLKKEVNFNPSTPIEEGLKQFVDWYKGYYNKTKNLQIIIKITVFYNKLSI